MSPNTRRSFEELLDFGKNVSVFAEGMSRKHLESSVRAN